MYGHIVLVENTPSMYSSFKYLASLNTFAINALLFEVIKCTAITYAIYCVLKKNL